MTAPNSAPAAPEELRKLPRADRLLEAAERAGLVARLGHGAVMEAIRADLERVRSEVLAGSACPPAGRIEEALLARLAAGARGSLRPVVNATGVVVHTNLGRAPLSEEAIGAMRQAAEGYTNLEYDLERGERGDRYGHAEAALCRLTGAEGAVVVNNNASAVMLALAALVEARPSESGQAGVGDSGSGRPGAGRPDSVRPEPFDKLRAGSAPPSGADSNGGLPEVVVSRGGAALVEVGTTNRTYRRDFEEAIGPRTRMLLSVHRSNFRVSGFVHDTPLDELVRLGRERDLWVVDDLGSGTLLETAPFGLGDEPTVQARVRAGPDVVTFSGDKLLGGPQAGILAGRREAIRRVKRHPLMRALRVDKVTLAGLSATLAHYERCEATVRVPVWRAIALSPAALEARAHGWLAALGDAARGCEVREGRSAVGGGSLPEVTLPTSLLALPRGEPDRLLGRLRAGDPPIVARIEDDRVVLDPRTVMPGEDEAVVRGVQAALGESRSA